MLSETLISALRHTAGRVGNDRGLRFYSNLDDSTFRGWAELDARARRVAQSLQSAGYQPGQRAVVALLPGLQWADAAYGALYAGLVLVPAPVAGYGTATALIARISDLTVASEASLIITEQSILGTLGSDADALAVPVRAIEGLLHGDDASWTEPSIDAESTSFLLYTSGSTGDPKGAIGTHGTFLATVDACVELFELSADSTVVGWSPLHHAMGLVLQVIVPAVLGAQSVLLATDQFQRRPLVWLQLLSRHRGTMSFAGNFAFALTTQLATDEQVASLDLSNVTALLCGSEPVRPETMGAFLERFAPTGLNPNAVIPAMGMTEAMLVSAKRPHTPTRFSRFDGNELAEGSLTPSSGEGSVEMVSNGRPSRATNVVIVDPDSLMPCLDGKIGEIWVSSPMIGPGYFRRPDATAETFGHRLPGDDREYLRTGDLASILDGELYITGRLKEIIIVRGRNVYPNDLEAAASIAHPALGVSAAFELQGHPSAVGIVAEYDSEAVNASNVSLADLADALRAVLVQRASLPSVAVALVEAGTIPRTATGKVRRRPTRAALEDGSLPVSYSRGYRDPVRATA
jgi:acyl-CoA synthetase (AMP-forming)/AMP-acid ligase II